MRFAVSMDYKGRYTSAITVLCIISCVLLWLTAIINCVAFGTREWLVSDGYSPFLYVGFFVACFDQCGRPYCPVGDDDMVLDKCYNLWPWFQDDYYIQEQWDWLTPEWFKTCRILVIINVPVTFCSAFILTLAVLLAMIDRITVEPDRNKDILLQVLLYVAAFLNLLGGMLGIGAVSHFYGNAFMRNWMPMPYKNSLGYSFYLEVTCSVFLLFSAVFSLLAGMFKTLLVLEGGEEAKFADDMTIT